MSNRSRIPSYRKHKQSGQAIVTLVDGLGGRRDVLLGPHGTPESRAEYLRVIGEWEAAGRRLPQRAAAADLSVNELIVAFWTHAEQHYRHPDGRPTSELDSYKLSLRPLKELYGHTSAKDFGPLALKAVRQSMIDAGLCRRVVNQRTGRIRRMYKWAVAEQLLPETVFRALLALAGLQRGRSEARETAPVKPVADHVVNATLPHLLPQVAAMVQLQRLTGARPGEVVIMRTIDLDTSGAVWTYRPGSDQEHGIHKTSWRGHQRVILIGPRAEEVLRPWLRLGLTEFLFSPREAMENFWAARRKARKTRVQPSQQRRRKARRKQRLRDRYTIDTYGRAIARGCIKAELPAWHPNQLRHSAATEIRKEAGLDAARAVLGHRSSTVTEIYAEVDTAKAAEIMERLG